MVGSYVVMNSICMYAVFPFVTISILDLTGKLVYKSQHRDKEAGQYMLLGDHMYEGICDYISIDRCSFFLMPTYSAI